MVPSEFPPGLFNFEPFFEFLLKQGASEWCGTLRNQVAAATSPGQHGNLADWIKSWEHLPALPASGFITNEGCIEIGQDTSSVEQPIVREHLMKFHPWRKGPFRLFDIFIDCEWRSDWKWDRVRDAVELRNRSVLDVGSGNGYFGWRMLEAEASIVAGLDPFLLYVMQHEAIKRYAGPDLPNFVLPLGDNCITPRLRAFDVVFSMGVLYHRTSPIDHLQALHNALQPGGQLVLETLIIDHDREGVLMPQGRYAKMRNVWFLPGLSMLQLWLRRIGFRDIKIVDVTATTTDEQRSTEWMTFESLADFLDPHDHSKTVEGYPAPTRAIVTARS